MAKFKIKKKDCLLTVKAGDAGAKADIGVQLYGEDGKLKPQFGASAKAEATAAELEGSLGVNVLGGEVGGMVDTVCDAAESAWNGLEKGGKTATNWFK